MKKIIIIILFNLLFTALYAQKNTLRKPIQNAKDATTVLYRKELNAKGSYPELLLNGVACRFTDNGLIVTGKENVIQLDKYYSLGERLVRYHVRFSANAKAIFQSNTSDFKFVINVPEQSASIESDPITWKRVTILPDSDYLIEIQRIYQQSKVIVTDLSTGKSDELEVNGDGTGGVGAGATGSGHGIVHQWDKYCFGLLEGTSLTVKQICVQAMECDLTLLLYGDSQTQPEGYFPAADFPLSWTQLIMSHVKGRSMSSGRGGCTIREVLDRIKNELPYIKAKYVMVTIGTNGGNTEENLGELIGYIMAQGSTPILNNIPSNEHNSQVEANQLIEKVRQKYNINGCRFDIATSVNRDGKEVDKSTMWQEDYSAINDWGEYYHHPNIKGSRLIYFQTLIDTPEIYE